MYTTIRKRPVYHKLIALVTASFFFLSIFTSDIFALAPELRSKPFSDATRLEFQQVHEMMLTAGKLKSLIQNDEARPGNMERLNNELKARFPNGEVEIDTKLQTGKLTSTHREYKYAVFHFKKENRSIEARFFKDDVALNEDELKELGVKTDEDRRHFFNSPEYPALKSIWFARKRLKVAIIGSSGIGRDHALAYRKCGNVELAAVVDIDPAIAERSGKEFNVRYYTQIDDVLGLGDVDIIDICTPTQFHRDLAIKVAKAGKHCICEKPMSLSDAECGEMIEAFRRSGKVIGSVFQHRFSDAARQVREAIDKGWLGKILTITAETNWWRNPLYWSSPGRGTWRRDGGGILMVQAIHAIDLMLYFGGPITDISAMTSTQVHHIEAEDTGGALLRFNSGAIGVVQATTAANTSDYAALQQAHYTAPNPKEGHKVRVVGSLGTIMIENDTITEWNLADTGVKPNPRSTNRTEHHELLARNLDDIAGAAMRLSKPVVSAESAAATVGVVHAMYGAALTCERREAEMINSANLELTPDIPERTILCHVVTDSILPDMQLKEGVLNRLEANMRSPKFGEKIVALSVKNPDNAAEYMAKLSELKRQIESEYQGYKVQFDVACPKPEYVESIQRLGMQALAFDREGEGDIIQIEGIILALRALRTGSIASLISAYKTITGKDYTTDKADINELAKIMLFILPVRKIDVDKIGKINKLIEEYIKAAA